MSASADLLDLTSAFKVILYNGGVQSGFERLAAPNLFAELPRDRAHCSEEGANFDLVAECTRGDFTLTHFVMRGMRQATAPVRSGLLWVSQTEPLPQAYAAKFDNMTREQFEALPARPDDETHPVLFFETSHDSLEFSLALPTWRHGRFVHIKFIDRHPLGGDNFDVGTMGLVGFFGQQLQDASAPLLSIPESLDLCLRTLNPRAINQLHSDFIPQIQSETNFYLFDSESSKRALVSELASSGAYEGRLNFFYPDGESMEDMETLAASIAAQVGVQQTPCFAIVEAEFANLFVYPGDFASVSVSTLRDWVNAYLRGEAHSYRKSEPRPADDLVDGEKYPGLVKVVANSFDELVLDDSQHFFFDLFADWCGPCNQVAPHLAELARLLKDHPTIRIGKMDCDHNWVNKQHFPEPGIPNMKLFAIGRKAEPFRFGGERSVSGFLRFLHKHCGEEQAFDLDEMLKLAKMSEHKVALSKRVDSVAAKARLDLNQYDGLLESLSVEGIVAVSTMLETMEKPDLTLEQLESVLADWMSSADVKQLQHKAKLAALDAERRVLRLCARVRSEDEFDAALTEADSKQQLVVVDFAADWCQPCKMMAPVVGKFSEEFVASGVRFLKVDVDEVGSLARRFNISAMPTFVLLRGGTGGGTQLQTVGRVEGADPQRLRQVIEAQLAAANVASSASAASVA